MNPARTGRRYCFIFFGIFCEVARIGFSRASFLSSVRKMVRREWKIIRSLRSAPSPAMSPIRRMLFGSFERIRRSAVAGAAVNP